ncbi:methyltransferase [candidate division KSB1 bacterium]|nr:methyltransferase [candidate division KSB1 bacterium]
MKRPLSAYGKIYDIIAKIPFGCVATYGQIARLAGLVNGARQVGYALHALPATLQIPWHRVVNARGEISRLPDPDSREKQRRRLEREGVVFDKNGRISLQKYRWMCFSEKDKI